MKLSFSMEGEIQGNNKIGGDLYVNKFCENRPLDSAVEWLRCLTLGYHLWLWVRIHLMTTCGDHKES